MKQDEYAKRAEKELKSKIKLFKNALKNEETKNEFLDCICGSEIIIRLELFLPSDDPENFVDGLFLYMNSTGEIIDAEYYFRDSQNGAITRLSEDDLDVVRELFQDSFSLEIE